jgi:hypothetical protein
LLWERQKVLCRTHQSRHRRCLDLEEELANGDSPRVPCEQQLELRLKPRRRAAGRSDTSIQVLEDILSCGHATAVGCHGSSLDSEHSISILLDKATVTDRETHRSLCVIHGESGIKWIVEGLSKTVKGKMLWYLNESCHGPTFDAVAANAILMGVFDLHITPR